MNEWTVTDEEIRQVENLLLPANCHFAEDAKKVIRCWRSTDVVACAGSGKTTVLLAKLKLLADRMPLPNGSGICVLSHTNVAVNEINKRLVQYTDRILGYPNFVGTIQTFVDQFITLPYVHEHIDNYKGNTTPIIFVSDEEYGKRMWWHINKQNRNLKELIKLISKHKRKNESEEGICKRLYDTKEGLRLVSQSTPIAKNDRPSYYQYLQVKETIQKDDALIRYKDSYEYAEEAIKEFPVKDLLRERFQYVFIDEYQDCNRQQRNLLDQIFDSEKCAVFRIGDPDQAIYNYGDELDELEDWQPDEERSLTIDSSCRYGQKIADALSPLRKIQRPITAKRQDGFKPTLIIFDENSRAEVIKSFSDLLDKKKFDVNGVYKAIGSRKVGEKLTIGKYWKDFNTNTTPDQHRRYWGIINEIRVQLKAGRLYRVEESIRKLICAILHFNKIQNPETQKDFTFRSIRKALRNEFKEADYEAAILELAKLDKPNIKLIDGVIKSLIKRLSTSDLMGALPGYFLSEESRTDIQSSNKENIWIDETTGRRIQFSTIHMVKGETHDATLYLETEYRNSTDLNRIFHLYTGTKRTRGKTEEEIIEKSRKLAYVGMSRPRKLLCVAMQEATYSKYEKEGYFRIGKNDTDWEMIDLWGNDNTVDLWDIIDLRTNQKQIAPHQPMVQ